jgi:hypothetical protein
MSTTTNQQTPPASVLDLMLDPQLLGGQFASLTWRTWRVLLAALFALTPHEADADADAAVATFRELTQHEAWTTSPARELWVVMCLS